MTVQFGIAAFIALLAVTSVYAQIQGQPQQTTDVTLAVGQVAGEGLEWNIIEYEGSPVQWGDWGLWGICVGTCGIGKQRRQRICYAERLINAGVAAQVPLDATGSPVPGSRQGQVSATFTGPRCFGYLIEARGCQLPACPTPSYGSWGQWGVCSVSCGGGVRSRTRSCLRITPCLPAALAENQQCNIQPCPVVPVWGLWTDWGSCSVPCGGGTQTRSRSCLSGSCPVLGATDTRQCNTQICSVVWALWGNWGQCSVPCGGGSQSRTRTCVGGNCPALGNSESQPCNVSPCAPQYGIWLNWGACTLTCGGGTQTRTRLCLSGNCPAGTVSEARQCNVLPCETIGFWSEWGQYSACTTTCGAGTQTKTRVCIGSRNCPGSDTETSPCNIGVCVGTWGIWSSYSICTRECGGGTRVRTRACTRPGTCAGNGVETQNCNEQPCTVYVWGQWQPFGSCSSTCGQGTYTRSRGCLENGSPSNNIAGCLALGGAGDATETQFCYGLPCYAWSSWSTASCSVTCGTGIATKVRVCQGGIGNQVSSDLCSAVDGGSILEEPCLNQPCLSWNLWGEWQSCSKACGGGKQQRMRACLSNGQVVDNSVCNSIIGSFMDERDCNVGPCYAIGAWRDWTACSASCGPGSQTRIRPCLANGAPITLLPGQRCGDVTDPLFETISCIVKRCCAWSEWSPSSCSVTCGSGTATRVRGCQDGNGISVENSCCSSEGGSSVFTESCQATPCLTWGVYGIWQGCSRPCGGGKEMRMRPCLANGQVVDNSVCDSIFGNYMEERDCNVGPCYSIGAWQEWTSCSASCGPGSQTRTRPCLANGAPVSLPPGQPCGAVTDPLFEVRSCIVNRCCGAWSQWSPPSCSVTCGRGTATRFRTCQDENGNTIENSCCSREGGTGVSTEACQLQSCYSWSLWTSYTTCSASCGEGQYRRSRGCVAPDGTVAPDPSVCPDPSGLGSLQIRPCRIGPCYSWQSWSQSSCSVTCGVGIATRSRRCTTRDGKAPPTRAVLCPDPANRGSTYAQPCNLGPCYSWTLWSEYTACSSSCGAGQQFRSRRCVVLGGANAPDVSLCEDSLKIGATEYRPCAGSGEGCFELGPWESWGRCTSSCGQGTITRIRSCRSLSGVKAPNSACQGYKEEDFIIRGTCARSPCPGVYGAWTSWGACTRSCDSGTRLRTRRCQGEGCVGVDRQIETCNPTPCGVTQVTGTWSAWGSWSACTAPCGGTKTKTRRCVGGRKSSDCGAEDYIRTIKCTDCPAGDVPKGDVPKGDSCAVEISARKQCQDRDIPRELCIIAGCCYDINDNGVTRCYHRGN